MLRSFCKKKTKHKRLPGCTLPLMSLAYKQQLREKSEEEKENKAYGKKMKSKDF